MSLAQHQRANGDPGRPRPVAIETETTTTVVTSMNQPVTVKTPPAARVSAVPHRAIGRRFA